MLSHIMRCLGPRQRNRQCAVLWIVLSASLPLLPNRPMTVKAGGGATSLFSAITLSTEHPDGSQSAGKDTQAIGVFGLGGSAELLLPARQTVAQPKPIWQETQASFGQVGAAQGDKNARRLDPGKPTEQGLEGGQSYFYKIALAAGEYLRVEVDQRGIDVVVSLVAPDGKQEMEVNLTGPGSPEAFTYEPPASGDYLLTVRALGVATLKGSYEVRSWTRAEATAQDRRRIAAERLLVEANQLSRRGPAVAEQMHNKAQQSLALWRELDDQYWAAYALNLMGNSQRLQSRPKKAIEYLDQALAIRREIKDQAGEGNTLNLLGIAYHSMGQYEKAHEYWTQSLTIRREVKDRAGEGDTLNNLGIAYHSFSQYENAVERYKQALAIRREVRNRVGEAGTLNNLGMTYRLLSRYENAIECFEQSLAIKRGEKDIAGEAQTIGNLGAVYFDLSQYQKAIEYYEAALAIMRRVKDRAGEARALRSLGNAYRLLNHPEKAIKEYYEPALAIMREVNDRAGEGTVFSYLGSGYAALNQYEKAIWYYEQGLAIDREVKDLESEGHTLGKLGNVYSYLNRHENAIEYYEQALAIRREVKDKEGEASILFNFARVECERGDYLRAKALAEDGLKITESLRSEFYNQELRSTYFASVQDYYMFYLDLLMRLHQFKPGQGFDALALQASERARARVLLEQLSEVRADIRQGVDPALLERERILQRQLNARASDQTEMLSGKHTEAQAADIAKEIEELTAQYQQVEAQIRATSPRYAALTQPRTLTFAEIQQQALDPDTLLLEYALGKERSHLWALTQNSINSYELPKREVIEEAAGRAIKLFSANNPAADKTTTEAATALSQMILGPAAEQLGAKRLLVVADGVLQYLPFGALPAPTTEAGSRQSRAHGGQIPLIVQHEIVNLPSASTLALLRREQNGRQPAAHQVAVLADPVFDRNDPRLKLDVEAQSAEGKNQSNGLADSQTTLRLRFGLERSAREVGVSFDRLRFSRREAEAIAALTREGERLKALDFAASRATALSEELGRYRIIHFATHGLLNSQHPELSGLVLSLVDERGQPQDGFLRAHEVYNLKLNADLVVLSGCRTALGKDVKGEGMVGLTRGFMYAGAPRVVASLWQVSDKATADLMKRFYKGMLAGGLRPAAALRAAQVAMWKEKRAPYFWAAFVLQGEWH